MLDLFREKFSFSKFFHIGEDDYERINEPNGLYMNDETIKNYNNGNGGINDNRNENDSNSTISDSTFDSRSTDGSDPQNLESESETRPLLGMILVTISAFCYAALNLSVSALMDETPWQEMMFIRMCITWMATMIWIFVQNFYYQGQMSLWGPRDKRLLLTWRAFFLWGAMFCCWWSFEFLPVGDATTLAMSFPVWVTIIAHFVFRNQDEGINSRPNDRLDLWGWLCVFSGLIGVIFVAQPSFLFGGEFYRPARDVGIVLGLCSALCAGAQYVIVNYTKDDCHWLQVEQITSLLSTFVFMPIGFALFAAVRYYNTGKLIIGWDSLNAVRWTEEIGLGLLGFCALALLTRGSQLDAPARTAICLYLQIPVTYMGQCLMSNEFPNGWVFSGMILVLISVIVPAGRKLRASRLYEMELAKEKEEAKLRQEAEKMLNKNIVDSDVSSDDLSSDNEQPLLDRYKNTMTDMMDIPKYTIDISNTSLISIGARNSKNKRTRMYRSNGNTSNSSAYDNDDDNQSSSSDASL